MASKTGNDATRALRRRQELELRAVRAVEQAAGTVQDAQRRRHEAVARLDQEVGAAAAAHGLAVAVLATVLRDDGLAADLTGVDVARVRSYRRGADGAAVRARIAELGEVLPRRRRTAVHVPDARPSPVGDAGGDGTA
ncbi:hypothetical protein ACIBSS_29055 [Micromonospora aurantiaca]|uniref:hypothetical protein n=1 Tax=Micromonospora aurantiaca (nom. illeg.) TaxID=47850 RepID=UPI000F3BAFE1|nr:hypothetical protein [Micromonospora aurantiaca]RNH98844.1 hypothetical protein EEZ25_24400 [Micromonospora aurantiaca]